MILTGLVRRTITVMLSSRFSMSWFTTVAPMTVLAIANVERDSFTRGINTDESNMEKRRVKVSFVRLKRVGGKEMDVCVPSSEVAFTGPEYAAR